MKTAADLQAYCESRFPVGEPTTMALSVTGEEYVVIGDEVQWDELSLPGIVREGKEASLGFEPEDTVWGARACFDAYATDKIGVLYWRHTPVLEQEHGSNRWRLFMRCLISDRPVRPEFRDPTISGMKYNIVNPPPDRMTLERGLLELLRAFEWSDFGNFPAYVAGEWSHSNLAAIVRDLEWKIENGANPLKRLHKSADPVQHPWGGAF